jgi:hypothetical protein
MTGLSQWRVRRRQLRHHRPFRIAAPEWTAAERARLAALLDDLAAAAVPPPVPSTSDSESPLKEKELAEAATNLWRARRRLARMADENSREAKRVGRYLLATQDALDAAGVLIQDHDGAAFHPGLSLEVLTFQDDPDLSAETVQETVRPSVYLADRRIQVGQVIVGCPVDQANTTTAEESRA